MQEILSSLLYLVILMGFSAFFSASETALMSLSASQLARMKKGNALDKVICMLVSNPQRLLSVILVGNMFVNVLLTAICASLLSMLCMGSRGDNGFFFMTVLPALQYLGFSFEPEQLGSVSGLFSTILNIALVTPALIIMGELTPKSVAYGNATTMARIAALPLKYLSRLILPIVWVLEMICKFLQKLLKMDTDKGESEVLSRTEIAATLHGGAQSGSTSKEELQLLESIIQFDMLRVRDIMIPLSDAVMIDDSTSVREAYDQARRIPGKYVAVSHQGRVRGAMCFTDYPRWVGTIGDMPLSALDLTDEDDDEVTSPLYPPKKISDEVRVEWLLSQMRDQPWKIVIVEDVDGREIGILTLERILEGVVGATRKGDKK
ncbi:MAG: CNNM domain-containing protein [Sutterella sp.]|nr:CNNM domain-containing protein [Sutterella sp.]